MHAQDFARADGFIRDSLRWGLGRIARRCLGSPQAPRMKGGPVLHLEHTRRGVRTTELVEAQWAVRAAAEAGEGAEIVDGPTGQVIERHPPQRVSLWRHRRSAI
jgi:hypothetical protein